VSNGSVTDEIILEGFRSLAEAMANGFDRVDRQLAELRAEMNVRFVELETRMMRRFDETQT